MEIGANSIIYSSSIFACAPWRGLRSLVLSVVEASSLNLWKIRLITEKRISMIIVNPQDSILPHPLFSSPCLTFQLYKIF